MHRGFEPTEEFPITRNAKGKKKKRKNGNGRGKFNKNTS
jgi:hypothetical protein